MNKTWIILVISIIVVFLLPGYWIVNWIQADQRNPGAQSGFMDLRGWDFDAKGTVKLNGEWELYRGQLLTPEAFRNGESLPAMTGIVTIPGRWNDYIADDGEPQGTGTATFRLRIRLDEDDRVIYGVKTAIIRSANRIYVNGQEIGMSGVPAANREAADKESNIPYVGFAAVTGNTAELIVQVSNYNYSSGGMITAIEFGSQQSILKVRERNLYSDVFTSASFLIPALYFLLLYRLRREERSLLYLGGFCVAGMVYVLTHGEKLLAEALSGFSYEFIVRIQLISSAFVYYCLLHYLAASNRRIVHKLLLHLVNLIAWGTLLIAAFLPPLMFSAWEAVYFCISVIGVLYAVYVLLRGLQQQTGHLMLTLISIQSILSVMVINILSVYGILNIDSQIIVPYDLLLFVLAQAVLLARRFAKSFHDVEQLSRKLLTLDGLKDEFLANTSHELRTPLHGIINIAASLLEGAAGRLNVKQAGHLSMIVSTGKRLSSLVNDILDFSKLKNGEIVLRRQAVDLRAVADAVIEVVRLTAGRKELRFIQEWPQDLPWLDADEDRLQQILFNLLGNAVKFTPRGEIRIYARHEDGIVTVSVADTGIGISPKRFEDIFLAFDQDGLEVERDYTGTGLGLSITKKLVELGGGRIWLESELGAGSVFHFTLPAASEVQAERRLRKKVTEEELEALELTAAAGPAPIETKGGTILVVEDDPVNQQVLINLLSMDGYMVIAANEGSEALNELIRRTDIDLIITDWMMPGMSGLELCRTIRKRFKLFELPVLMLTARSRLEDIQAGFQAGINDFLAKPVDAGELRARVHTLIELRKSVQTAVRTEMAFLQAQIKPHFLYNALNTMIAVCPVDPDKAVELLIELSHYLRASFDFQNYEQLTPVHKELELVRSYLILEKARFDERLHVEYTVEGNLNARIPPLSIQPIVENAVRHGLMQKSQGGTIQINITITELEVSVVVADDGMGMRPERMQQVLSQENRSGGVGLRNVHRRLLTMYGKGLYIESEWKQGTTVSFTVPRGMPEMLQDKLA